MSFGRFLSDVCDGIPIVGHVKGAIHHIAGDKEEAKRAYMSATRSTLVLGGGALGSLAGPVGAAALAAYAGVALAVDTVTSAVTNKPVGVVRNVKKLAEAQDLEDVIVGVGRMGLDIGLDAATGASAVAATKTIARLSTKSIARLSTKQLVKSAPKEAVRHAKGMAQTVAAFGLVTKTQQRREIEYIDNDPSASDPSSSSEEDEDSGFIYLFTLPDGSYKVGMTRRESVLPRLNEHRRNDLIKPYSDITVYVCPRNVTRAEAMILSEIQIYNARIRRVRRTEILDNRNLELQYVKGVIRRVVAQVNNIPESAVKTIYYRFNNIKITRKYNL